MGYKLFRTNQYYARAWIDLKVSEIPMVIAGLIELKNTGTSGRLERFEKEYAKYIGVRSAVAFPNCRSAIYHSLKALELKDGDEVILPAFTFWVDAAMVVLAGLKPVFVDVDLKTMNIDVSEIESVITEKTRVIMPTHLNGLPADMEEIMSISRKHNLKIIEDCARACGATCGGRKVGAFDIGTFSFGYGKSFYGFGGGMVTTNDDGVRSNLLKAKKSFRNAGKKEIIKQVGKGILQKILTDQRLFEFYLFPRVYEYQIRGNQKYRDWFQYKMPEYSSLPKQFKMELFGIQSKMGIEQLKRIDRTNERRIHNVAILNRELKDVSDIMLPSEVHGKKHVYVHYTVWTRRKNELQKYLFDHGVDAQDETAMNIPVHERFRRYSSGLFKNAEKLHGNILFLPTHPSLGEKDMLYIGGLVRKFFS